MRQVYQLSAKTKTQGCNCSFDTVNRSTFTNGTLLNRQLLVSVWHDLETFLKMNGGYIASYVVRYIKFSGMRKRQLWSQEIVEIIKNNRWYKMGDYHLKIGKRYKQYIIWWKLRTQYIMRAAADKLDCLWTSKQNPSMSFDSTNSLMRQTFLRINYKSEEHFLLQ